MNRVQIKKKKGKDSSKTIGLIIPTTTRSCKINKVDDLIFFRIFLPSFLKYASNTHFYNFFLGYDYDDPFYSKEENREEFRKRFEQVCPKTYSLTFVEFGQEVEKGDLSTMWSLLADQAVKTNEYLYQLGDDIEFKSKGWEDLFIALLGKVDNIGAVGPKDEQNPHGILTQSFVHCTHLSIFKRYFPKELKNWYIDDWISEVYDIRVEKRAIVHNRGGKEKYEIKDIKEKKDRIVRRDRELIQKINNFSSDRIFRINSLSNSFFIDDHHLVLSNKNFINYDIGLELELNSRHVKTCLDNINKKEMSFTVDKFICHRSRNFIAFKQKDGVDIVQNVENKRLEPVDEPIYLVQQFFIPHNDERYQEIKECIRRNIEGSIFEKIFLLNERIYSAEELGVVSDKIIQVNIGKRLTYKDFFRYIDDIKGFLVLSNSDIFFDESIMNVRTSVMRKVKSVQCLRRYEYRKEKDLKECILYSDFKCAQDVWIFHHTNIKKINNCDFNLGTPGCDNKFAHILRMEGYVLLNDYQNIRSYHNHASNIRSYSTGKQLPGPFTFVLGPDMHITETLMNLENLFWQYPVITEKEFYKQNKNDPSYIGFPWATVIDKKPNLNIKRLVDMLKTKKSYTCCQHISFRSLIPLLKKLGITKLYTPHKQKGEDEIDGIKLYPCPLYAKIIEDNIKDFEIDLLTKSRKYLYSFKGGYQQGYMSDIRLKIFQKLNRPDVYIENTGEWHFNQIVYDIKQNKNGDYNGNEKHFQNERSYKDLLLNSRYTLCPSGSGPNSIRFWEALGSGSIPILLSDKLELSHRDDWEDSILVIKEDNIDQLDRILSRIDTEKENKMRKNCLKIYQELRNNYKGK